MEQNWQSYLIDPGIVMVKTAITDNDIASCWEAMSLLRPMLKREDFVEQVKSMQREGYALIYITEMDKTASVAGYRFLTMLHCGKMLYIDDLSTLEECRGKGYAAMLLNHIYAIAKKENCLSVQLDSGPARSNAHKLYLREDFTIYALHFYKSLL